MKEQEIMNTTIKTAENKKHYIAPKIEMIGAVKDATRGAVGAGNDSGGRVPVPSDPNGGGWQ